MWSNNPPGGESKSSDSRQPQHTQSPADEDSRAAAVSALASFSQGSYPPPPQVPQHPRYSPYPPPVYGYPPPPHPPPPPPHPHMSRMVPPPPPPSERAVATDAGYKQDWSKPPTEAGKSDPPESAEDESRRSSIQHGEGEHTSDPKQEPTEDEPDEMEVEAEPVEEVASSPEPRGKPEAMAAALAAAQIEAKKQELEGLRAQQEVQEAEVVAEAEPVQDGGVLANLGTPPKKPAPRKRATPKRSRKTEAPTLSNERTELLLNEPTRPISDDEHDNLERLMIQFCRVPLLSEFSRPVSLLHPELVGVYSKIVSHPVDLGHVCRGVRRRQYTSTRDIRLDMWRVFANCVKFHSHPKNQEAVPSFVSIALHLREYFNNLWQEYMLPSDLPSDAEETIKVSFARRAEARSRRMENSGVLVLSKNFLVKTGTLLGKFVANGGRVDKLDKEPVFSTAQIAEDKDVESVVDNLKRFQARLADMDNVAEEYTLDALANSLKQCYTGDLLEDNVALQNRIGNRLDRFFWKRTIPLHEANTRGVTQSSIWGNAATTIWARESSKKPYWPALCLGILPPEDQREGWHLAITQRNEERLPEKLAMQLRTAKKRCEQAQKRQALSYFLVEFLGTHEFIWVRETDIVEKFDPADDPNKSASSSKKKRQSRSGSSVVGSKTYATALQECAWASEEYESIVQDAFEDDDNSDKDGDEDEDEGEMNYSYAFLALTDDEADDEDEHGFHYDEEAMGESDIEEANWLLAHDGMIETASIGKRKPKRKPQAAKKKSEKDKKDAGDSARKSRAEQQKRRTRAREEKKELRELEKRRRKRTRDREKALKDEARKLKRRRAATSEVDEDVRGLSRNKRARATAVVKAYLTRTAKSDADYKSLALNGVMTMPAAMVDPNGLLGMALAFRAAAGVLNMPDDSEEQIAKATKPWAAIDTTGPKTSAQRTKNLEKQIELLEKEIVRVRANTATRRKLTQEAIAHRIAKDRETEVDDEAARLNHFKKRKKVVKPGKTPEAERAKATGFEEDDDASGAEPTAEMDDGGIDEAANDDLADEAVVEAEPVQDAAVSDMEVES